MDQTGYEVTFENWEDYWSVYAEVKGFFDGVFIRDGDATYRPRFIDPVRLSQEIAQTIALDEPYVIERNTVVIERVTREAMLAAIGYMASRSFADLA